MNQGDVSTQRWILLGLVFSTTAAATTRLFAIFRVDHIGALEVSLLTVFALLFAWIATSFWISCLGAHALWSNNREKDTQLHDNAELQGPDLPRPSRTVLVVPIHNEDCAEVFARLQAMEDCLRETGANNRFDIFVLSDSRNPEYYLDEIAAWRRFRSRNPDVQVFYRRRETNTGHKSGNIADFCENWGALYDYMIVLDADSLMAGRTLIRLVQLMDANPRTALIQAAPLLVGGETLFARSQQFASWVYGPLYSAGLARLQGVDGNYWGHNAIIRVKPFMDNCGLPILPGRQPLGGEIMSHDFVEAALLRRAGWEVRLVTEAGGSYEATPPTLLDHLKRDRRWCQGNLQHVRILFAQGLRLPSRLHLAFGALSYLSSPLWLISVLLFIYRAVQLEYAQSITYVGRYPVLAWPVSQKVAFISLAVATMAMFYIPKLLAVLVVLRRRPAARAYGGPVRLCAGAVCESIFSTLSAPVFMLSHTWFVLTVLVGRNSRWGTQPRGTVGIGLGRAISAFAPHTIFAAAF